MSQPGLPLGQLMLRKEEKRRERRAEKWRGRRRVRQRKEGGREASILYHTPAPSKAPMNTQFFPLATCRHNLYHDINPGCPQDICERQVPAALLKCPSCKHSKLPCYQLARLAPAACWCGGELSLHLLSRPGHGRKGESGGCEVMEAGE